MCKRKIYGVIKQCMPLLISLLAFSVLISGVLMYADYRQEIWDKDVKARLSDILVAKKTKLEQALYSRVYYTRSVAAYVSIKPQVSNDEFYNLADELIQGDTVISTMALSKDGVINAVYPLKGHEAAIGLNLLLHPERKEIVRKTMETHESFVAGPVELVEGGVAFISYTPIFDKTVVESDKFWGMTDIVIYRDRLLAQASLKEAESGFLFALRGYNGTGDQGDIWWGNKEVFDQDPVVVYIELPYGNWALGAVPETGWNAYLNQDNVFFMMLVISSLVICLLIWFISRAIIQLRMNAQELKAILNSLDSVIIEFDQDGRYLHIPTSNTDLLFRPKEIIIGKTVYEVFPAETARMFHEAIKKCLDSRRLVVLEYSLRIGERDLWFLSRISWKSEHRVIFHAFDITGERQSRSELIKSEQQLKDINATKDKFFSIIAHDLRSPFNSILGAVDLLRNSYDGIKEEERRALIDIIGESTQNTFNLLENLLLWANSQTDKIKIVRKELVLYPTVQEAIAPYLPGAVQKNIHIDFRIPDELIISADEFGLKTILGNLFSNAVKYTPAQGQITISAVHTEAFTEVSVADNGVGISPERIAQLFVIGSHLSTPGTDNEKGTGLGLLLCKEFIEKHHGTIWVESDLGKGTTFHFRIPS